MSAEKELTFWDHLDELRKVIIRILAVWFVLAVGYFVAMPWLFDRVILAPCTDDFIFYDFLRSIAERLDLHDEFFTQEFHIKYSLVCLYGTTGPVGYSNLYVDV